VRNGRRNKEIEQSDYILGGFSHVCEATPLQNWMGSEDMGSNPSTPS
jgi:hypothetical protein